MAKKTGVKNRRLLFAKNSIMMLVMLVVIFLAIFAWYIDGKSVEATGITVSSSVPDDIQIAKQVTAANDEKAIGSWGGTINFDDSFAFSNDVTSNGLEFIIPGFNTPENNSIARNQAYMNGKIVNDDGIPSSALSNLDIASQQTEDEQTPDYYACEFYVRSTNSRIVVNPTAYLAMAAEKGLSDTEGHSDITGPNSARKSIYGNFTSDAIVAAMRVSIDTTPVTGITVVGEDHIPTTNGEYSSNFVWNPRPDLFLNIPYGTNDADWTLQTNVTKETSLYRLRDQNDTSSHPGENLTGETFKHNYYAKRYYANTDIVNGVTYREDQGTGNANGIYKSDTSKLSDDPEITNGAFVSGSKHSVPTLGVTVPIIPTVDTNNQPITYTTDDEGYYVFKFRLNIWIEGTDTEARRAMDTGKFNLFLEFSNAS